MNIAAELRNAVIDNFTIDKRLVSDAADAIEMLGEENDKLRELISDMWRFMGTACKKYPRLFDPAAQGGQMVQPNMIDSFEQRMRELGIGVEP